MRIAGFSLVGLGALILIFSLLIYPYGNNTNAVPPYEVLANRAQNSPTLQLQQEAFKELLQLCVDNGISDASPDPEVRSWYARVKIGNNLVANRMTGQPGLMDDFMRENNAHRVVPVPETLTRSHETVGTRVVTILGFGFSAMVTITGMTFVLTSVNRKRI